MTQKLLLLADDQEDNLVIFSAILRHHGFAVVLATNGKEAVELARYHAPKLILMDLQMPVMDGWEATRLLKSSEATGGIPIVAVTAEDHNAMSSLQKAGFCAYIRKPATPERVVRAVRHCLEQSAAGAGWIDLASLESPGGGHPPIPPPLPAG